MKFVEILLKEPSTRSLQPVSDVDICAAERKINTRFSFEYKEYLSAFGTASTCKHEFTGLCDSTRLNVIDVTLLERKKHIDGCDSLYVVESLYIDKIVIWQDSLGKVYKTVGNSQPVVICQSLIEYIQAEMV